MFTRAFPQQSWRDTIVRDTTTRARARISVIAPDTVDLVFAEAAAAIRPEPAPRGKENPAGLLVVCEESLRVKLSLDGGRRSELDSAGTLAKPLVGTHLEGPSAPRAFVCRQITFEEVELVHGRYALALSCVLLGWASAAAQTVTQGPWTRVPAAPASYFSDDDFIGRVDNEYAAIVADIDKQAKLNAAIKKSFDEMDMTQKMQRMQAYMTKNPQEAMKAMQAMQAAANTTTTGIVSADSNNTRLQQELTAHKTDFNASVERALKPIQARQEEMIKTRTRPAGEAGWEFKSAADLAQFAALVQQENAEYEKVCASFFGPKGTLTAWLASYKDSVAKNMISAGETADSTIVAQLAIMDTPTGGYRSTAGLEGVRDYLGKLREVYSLRRHKKTPPTA